MAEIQTIGANILLNHETPAANLPPELIQSLINSPHQSVRVIGVRIFGQLPDTTLLQSYQLILAMATHELSDMREAIRPVVRRLAGKNTEFASQLTLALIEVLVRKEKQEGIHSYIISLMGEDLAASISNLTKDTALRLLRAKPAAAQELGGLLLEANCRNWAVQFDTATIVKLGSHEILSVRQAAWAMFAQISDRIRNNEQEKLAAVRLLEAKWDDSKEFALGFFNTHFTQSDWTPAVMISICDSIKDDVRQFGRDLVKRYFRESYGQEYLLKFSEHPSGDMQLFATNYLEEYAVDNSERLRLLKPYFITVLSRINRGRKAKDRVFAFLEAEGLKSWAAAEVVAEILTKQSVTMAIGDKAKAIQIMVKLKKQYSDLDLPIQVKEVAAIK